MSRAMIVASAGPYRGSVALAVTLSQQNVKIEALSKPKSLLG
jgi:hypothetical protein